MTKRASTFISMDIFGQLISKGAFKKMKRKYFFVILFLILAMFFGLTGQIEAFEQLNYADIWGVIDEEEKALLLFGVICGAMQDMILLGESAKETEDLKIIDFALDYLVYIATYASFYGEDKDNVNAIIGSIDGFYSDPDNKYCNPAGLAFISYLHLQGKDISKELIRLRYYAEVGTETLFKK